MNQEKSKPRKPQGNHMFPGLSRRRFLQSSALAAGAMMGVGATGSAVRQAAAENAERPNLLFVLCDQLSLDAISAHGCADVHTPNLDRLIAQGTTFMKSYSVNPVCGPGRSALMTGRMTVETGVVTNGRPIHPSIPNMGQWFREGGYDTVYCGKWHIPYGYPYEIDGFEVLPVGNGQGDLLDSLVTDSCEAWLKNRETTDPFLMIASYMQPHDICYWQIMVDQLVPETQPFPHLAEDLPSLWPNLRSSPPGPTKVRGHANLHGLTEERWQYYNYIYYRQVEMLDAEVGRLLDVLEEAGLAEETLVLFTSDHGEARGRHEKHGKWTPYEEAALVPMVVSWPGRLPEGARDDEHLISCLDVMSTFCDYAGMPDPPKAHGLSLRPLLEGHETDWRGYLVIETRETCRAVRTARYKYVEDPTDPTRQFFDLENDPWEMENLWQEAAYAEEITAHQAMLSEWNSKMTVVEPTPQMGYWAPDPEQS